MLGALRTAAVAIACLAAGGPAAGGAWLREAGTGSSFTSGSASRAADGTVRYADSFYSEWGLTPGLTLGVDSHGLATPEGGHALIFARLPLWEGAAWRLAAEGAVGAHQAMHRWAGMARVGLSLGRTIETRRGWGWLAVDTAADWREGIGTGPWKVDAALGLPLSPQVTSLFQVETAFAPDAPAALTLLPGVIIGRAEGNRFQLSLVLRQRPDRAYGVKLGFARRF